MEFQAKAPYLRIAKIHTSQGYAGTDREDIQAITADENADDLAWDLAINDGDGIPLECSECGDESEDCGCEDSERVESECHNIEGYFTYLEVSDLSGYATDILDILSSHNITKEIQGMLHILDKDAFCKAFNFTESPELWESVLDQFKERFNKIFDADGNILAEQKIVERYLVVTRTITTLEKVQAMTEKEYKDLCRDGDILEYTKTITKFRDKLSYRVAYGSEFPE